MAPLVSNICKDISDMTNYDLDLYLTTLLPDYYEEGHDRKKKGGDIGFGLGR